MVKNGLDDIREILYTPAHPDDSGVEVISLATLAQRMTTNPAAHRPQRPDFHLLLTVTSGVLWHMVDFRDYAVSEGMWLWVRPGQVQQFRGLDQAEGVVVMFPSSTLAPQLAAQLAIDNPFGPTLLNPIGDDTRALTHAVDHLRCEFELDATPAKVRSAILVHLLSALLLRLGNIDKPASTPHRAHEPIFMELRNAVERDFAEHRDVAYYAKLLLYSPRTLTRATHAAVGVSAKEFIDRRVILEAKRLLAHSDEPIARIGAQLGFDDASNFVKYFARHTSLTPTEARKTFLDPQ
ncbi:helix-turn-helix domain-containing protein [Corynebacterium lubricantis]|uniref:helix-turn-helix domain-containing protein n=1 Tax=Corynebacterium lubricantis TaxID=541095 RepID=UPI0003618B7B|nr:helix-turn-helix domain-containing protein [Corynebacterium lubricantis]